MACRRPGAQACWEGAGDQKKCDVFGRWPDGRLELVRTGYGLCIDGEHRYIFEGLFKESVYVES